MRQLLTVSSAIVLSLSFVASPAWALDAAKKTIEQVYLEKDKLAGKSVQVTGKVTKVNNGIMKRNFLHIVDGTGKEGTNDLTITSASTATVGDQVTVSGVVTLNVDFGMGYSYPLLLENSAITKK